MMFATDILSIHWGGGVVDGVVDIVVYNVDERVVDCKHRCEEKNKATSQQ